MLTNQNELTAVLTLHFATGLGNHTAIQLLEHYQMAEKICHLSTEELNQLKLKNEVIYQLKHPDTKKIEQAIQWLNQSDQHSIITIADADYPAQLKAIPDPPLLIYVAGDKTLLKTKQIAVVGSRNPSPEGQELAARFSAELCRAGLTITSGMAIGIDGIAHQTTLENQGKTIAVLGSGFYQLYPKRHTSLADHIKKDGCLVSEFPLTMKPIADHFPRRNRIVSGLCLGTLVVEASYRSGSLITARLSNEQGREVFAIPHSLFNGLGKGCLYLIQQGAKCVTTTQDILEEWPGEWTQVTKTAKKAPTEPHQTTLDENSRMLLECAGFGIVTRDQLAIRTSLSIANVNASLLNLELHGYIKKVAEGYQRCPVER